MPTSQNSLAHSNNSSAKADELFECVECVWPFCGFKRQTSWTLKENEMLVQIGLATLPFSQHNQITVSSDLVQKVPPK